MSKKKTNINDWMKEINVPEIDGEDLKYMMVIWDDANEPGDETHELNYFDRVETRHAPHISIGIVLKDDLHGVVICRDIQIHDGLSQKELCVPTSYIITKRYLK